MEGGPLGPGFPPKPVGLLVRSNLTRQEPTTPAPEGRFLFDGSPPIPPPPLRRRPLPKGYGRARNHLPQSGEDNQKVSEDDNTPIIPGPLFYEDLPPPGSSRQSGESGERSSENSAEVSREEYNRGNSIESEEKPRDSFNGLEQPDPTVSQLNINNPEPERSNEIENSRPEDEEKESQHNSEQLEDDRRPTTEEEEDENNVESNEEGPNNDHSGEEESETPENSAEDEEKPHSGEGSAENVETSGEEERPNPDQSAENEGPVSEFTPEEGRPEHLNSGEEEEPHSEKSEEHKISDEELSEEKEKPHANLPLQETGQHLPISSNETPAPQHSVEDNGANLSHTEEENPVVAPSPEGDGENQSQGAHSVEDNSSGEEEERPDSDYSEENNGINSSGEYVDYEDGPYRQQSEERESGEEVEGVRKPGSLENGSDDPASHSAESVEEPPQEDYDSAEEQRPPQISDEYVDEERQPDYYDLPDYDNLSPEPEYEDGYGRPVEEQGKRPHTVNYEQRPPFIYYVIRGPEGEKQEANGSPGFTGSSPKPPYYEDNRLKPSEDLNGSTQSAEEDSSSEENFDFGFDSFEIDADIMKTPPLKNNA